MIRAVATILFSVVCFCRMDAQFEGIVETRNLTTDELGSMQQFTTIMWIKKDRIRVQNTAFGNTPATTLIYRNDRHIIWMLNETDKTYFEMLQEEKPQGPESGREPSLEDKPSIGKTGRTKKILGYACEQVLLTRAEGETEIWGTKQLADLEATVAKVLGESGAEGGGWMEEVAVLGLYPLASSTRIEGKIVESQETTRIEVKDLSSDLFDLPPGFRKQSMGDVRDPPHE